MAITAFDPQVPIYITDAIEFRLPTPTSGAGIPNILFKTPAGLARWGLGLYNAEAGSDAGSDIFLSRYDDAGAFIESFLFIDRSTGVISTTRAVEIGGTLSSGAHAIENTGGGAYALNITGNDQSNVRLRLTNTGTGGKEISIVGGNPGLSNDGLALYNESDALTLLNISSLGAVSIASTFSAVDSINTNAAFFVDGVQVVNARKPGWALPSGTFDRTTFATGSVTLPELAERVAAVIEDLYSHHGLIGA